MSRKGENIYKRKDKRWEARYIKEYNIDGSAHYGYCYGKTYLEAKKKVTEEKISLLINKQSTSKIIEKCFSHYCDEWLQLNRTKVKESTYVKYSGIIEKHIKAQLGDCKPQQLSSITIEQFSHELIYRAKLAPKTVKDILTVLHSIIKYANKQTMEVLPKIEIAYPKNVKKEMRILTRDEQAVFVQYLLEDMDSCKFGVLLSLLTGMRIGEICALKWKNISLYNKTIQISSTMQRLHNFNSNNSNQTKIVISDPKSNNSSRIIPLTEYLVTLCKNNWCNNPDAFVLTGQSDKFIEPRTLQYRFKKYAQDCSLEGIHFHSLRHTFATRCVEVDFEIKSLSEILGHSSPRITLERYVHSSMELKRENMMKLESIGY